MNSPRIDCPKCKIPLEWQSFNAQEMTACPACNAKLRVDIFPAFFKDSSVPAMAGLSAIGDESVCFFHPQKKAAVACSMCGRFICSLCDIELGDQHVCPTCLEAGKKKKKIRNLETHRVLYDNIAIYVAIIPMILIWVTIISAPISIYMSIRYWKAPMSIIPRTKIRFIAAIAISLAQLAAWFVIVSHLTTIFGSS
jgi:hypothetical protein